MPQRDGSAPLRSTRPFPMTCTTFNATPSATPELLIISSSGEFCVAINCLGIVSSEAPSSRSAINFHRSLSRLRKYSKLLTRTVTALLASSPSLGPRIVATIFATQLSNIDWAQHTLIGTADPLHLWFRRTQSLWSPYQPTDQNKPLHRPCSRSSRKAYRTRKHLQPKTMRRAIGKFPR